jgi:hypothetical protein
VVLWRIQPKAFTDWAACHVTKVRFCRAPWSSRKVSTASASCARRATSCGDDSTAGSAQTAAFEEILEAGNGNRQDDSQHGNRDDQLDQRKSIGTVFAHNCPI